MTNFIAISAPSGAGKTTLCRELQRRQPEIQFSLSSTTRPQRKIETDGVDYNFISRREFNALITRNELAEYQEVHGYMYGTPKALLDRVIANGEQILFEVDVKGALSIKRLHPHRTITIFILPPDISMLRQRLRNRGTDNEQRIAKRLERLAMEIGYRDQFDFEIINDDIDRAVSQLQQTIKSHSK